MFGLTTNSPLGQRISQLSHEGAVSDFYITPGEPLIYRYNGKMIYDEFVLHRDAGKGQTDGPADYALSLAGHRFRVNRMITKGRVRWVMRLLPSQIPAPDDISVPPSAIKAFLEAKNGLFLVCGPTGSGKSTTIASMVLHRAQRRREHVITFEDPIEYIYPENQPSLFSQREIGLDAMDFAESLKLSLRQAPDVIVVGEIRDGETAEIALQAAETGHVVVATLHTSSAAQTVQRFLKLIPVERVETATYTLADILKMIMCQRLLLDDEKGKRFPIHELLIQYDSISNLIRRGDFKKLDQELEVGWKKGMNNFERSLQQRESEGWKPSGLKTTGFSEYEVGQYLSEQKAIDPAGAHPAGAHAVDHAVAQEVAG